MKVQIKIPTGWRRLRPGTMLKTGDRFNMMQQKWVPTEEAGTRSCRDLIYIRRKAKR